MSGTTYSKSQSQRDVMRNLFRGYSGDAESVISAYANLERTGEVRRLSNKSGLEPEAYARALLNDGLRKGWL